jgi:hypothetical protein
MPGTGGNYTKAFMDNQDTIYELGYEIEQALESLNFDEDIRLGADSEHDLLLKALIHYIISRFDFNAVKYVLNFYKAEAKERSEQR